MNRNQLKQQHSLINRGCFYQRRTGIQLKTILTVIILLLGFNFMHGQVANYSFSSSSGTYTPLTNGTVIQSVSWDDYSTLDIPLQFSFIYNSVIYDSVYINSNGFITFGTDPSQGYYMCGLQESPPNSIAGYGTDLHSASPKI